MKQHLRIFMALLMLMIFGGASFGQEVTLDFTTNNWKLPTSGGKAETQYSNGTYTISVSAGTEYKYNDSGYLFMGKAGSTLTLSAFSFDVEKIVVTGRSGASSSVKQNIYVGSKAVSTETTGITGTQTYLIADDYQAAGNVYVLKVTSSHNTQITKIEIYEKEGNKTATTLSFPTSSYTFDKDSGDKTFTNVAVLNPAEAGTVTYKSSNEDLAVVSEDGSVLVSTDNVGSATITASFAGNDKYKASEASYTIEVKKAAEDGVFDFSSPDLYGYDVPASSKNVEVGSNGTIIAGNVVITNVKDGGTKTRFYNNKGTIGLRVYKDAKLIISVPENYVVTDITIDANNTGVYTIGALNKNSVEIDFSNYTQIQSMIVKYVKLASLTTAASGFSTYAADYAVNYSEAGLKAYAVKVSDDKTKVAYTECTGVVPAGKAVLVKGTANTSYSLTPATEDADATFDTNLQISDGTKVSDGSTIFAFGTKNGVSGFKVVKSGVTIPAKKGYLVVEASAAGAKDFFAFDDSTNGIDDPTIEIPDDDVPLFNLAGQRVGKDYKGIVVKNGKKYVNK